MRRGRGEPSAQGQRESGRPIESELGLGWVWVAETYLLPLLWIGELLHIKVDRALGSS